MILILIDVYIIYVYIILCDYDIFYDWNKYWKNLDIVFLFAYY